MWKRLQAKANPAGSSEVWISFQNCHMLGKRSYASATLLNTTRDESSHGNNGRGDLEQNSYVVFEADPQGTL